MIYLKEPIVCIVGPTSSGKTVLAQTYAEQVSGEIISADSMQIYKGMDIGTGKIPAKERTVPYYGLDILEPGKPYSAALFQEEARLAINKIDSHGNPAILAGGTGFYVRAAIDDYKFPKGTQEDNAIRRKYEAIYKQDGADALWRLLNDLDPKSAECIHKNNVKRVIRALEIYGEGGSYARLSQNLKNISQLYDAIFIGLYVDREVLNQRINKRVDRMLEDGLVSEVKTLMDKGFRDGLTAPQAIGYKEVVAYFDGDTDLPSAIDCIKQATRRYAKRQYTWFNKDKRVNWIDATNSTTKELLDKAIDIIKAYRVTRKVK